MSLSAAALMCLSLNIYHEARDQGTAGMAMVADVTLNRVDHGQFPGTVCGVVHQFIGPNAQFSWYNDGLSDTPREKNSWMLAQKIAIAVYEAHEVQTEQPVLYYHANYVSFGSWADDLTYLFTIGDHLVYTQD